MNEFIMEILLGYFTLDKSGKKISCGNFSDEKQYLVVGKFYGLKKY